MTTGYDDGRHRHSLSTSSTPTSEDPNAAGAQQHPSALFTPLRLLNSVAVHGISALRPYAPQFIPIAICILLIPVAIFFSIVAGWTVWRSVAVGWEAPLYLQYGDNISPYTYTQLPELNPTQPYDFSVYLTLPASDSNISLGNFMTSLTLMTSSNRTLISVSRPAIAFLPSASLFRPLSLIFKPSLISLNINLLSSFKPTSANIFAYVQIGRKDAWRSLGSGEARELSIASASLRAIPIPHGIHGLAIRFPLTAAVLSSCTFMLILSFVVGSCILPTMFPVPLYESDQGKDRRDDIKGKHVGGPRSRNDGLLGRIRLTSSSSSNDSGNGGRPMAGLRTRRSKLRLGRRGQSAATALSPTDVGAAVGIAPTDQDEKENKVKTEEKEVEMDPEIVVLPSTEQAEASTSTAIPAATDAQLTLRKRSLTKEESGEE